MSIWIADEERGLMQSVPDGWRRVAPPCQTVCAGGGRIFCADQTRCLCLRAEDGAALCDMPLPGGVCALSCLPGAVCALSSEADCLLCLRADTGAPLFSAPAGVYPRDMDVSPGGQIAVAGGGAGEILLYDRALRQTGRHRVAGVPCAVRFGPRGLHTLVAVGDGELSGSLIRISVRGVQEELFRCPAAPCALCVLGDGRIFAGFHGHVFALRPNGNVLFHQSCALPSALLPCFRGVLALDAYGGGAALLRGARIYSGGAPCGAVEYPRTERIKP